MRFAMEQGQDIGDFTTLVLKMMSHGVVIMSYKILGTNDFTDGRRTKV